MSYGYIYKTTNLLNNRIYIGQHKGNFNPDYFGSGILIKKSLIRYGTDNFKVEFLTLVDNKEQLNNLEIEYIARYRSLFPREEMYNMTEGGEGGSHLGYPHSEKTKKKMRQAKLGIKRALFSKETREKMSKARLGRHHTEKTKEKISLTLTGRKLGPHTKEHRRKIGLGNKDKIISKETRDKISNALKKRYKR